MDYFLYLLVNANLFLRPAELVPDLERLPLYQWFILACLLVAIPKLMGLVSNDSPLRQPICLCVFGVFAFVTLSHLAQSDFDRVTVEVFEFLKVIVYFVLFLALVDTPTKLRVLLALVIVFGVITTAVAVLEYHGYIDLANLKTVQDSWTDERSGDLQVVRRLMLTGVLHDPNEFCVFLSVLSLLAIHRLTNPQSGLTRVFWLAPLGLFVYGIYLTQSRGGLLALVAGLGAVTACKWGWRRALAIGVLLLPMFAVGLAGRQTSISITQGTGQARLELWSDWLYKFRSNPLLGESPKIAPPEVEEDKALRWNYQQLAHNSYLQGFADLGIVGGMLFLGAFFFAFRTLLRLRTDRVTLLDPQERHLYPFVFGVLATYMVGMMSLSLCYVLPTYFILAIPVVFARQAATEPALPPIRFDALAWRNLAMSSVAMLALIYVLQKAFRA